MEQQFIAANVDYGRAKNRFKDALKAPLSDVGERVGDGIIYRGLAIALAELQSENQDDELENELGTALTAWKRIQGESIYFAREMMRLRQIHGRLMGRVVQQFPALTAR